jgi:hypothetical protein
MAMSATAAAKRRRAGGLLSSPMLQPPHVLQSIPANRLISTLQNIQQESPDQQININNNNNNNNLNMQNNIGNSQPVNNVEGNKVLTLQQVIKFLDTRIINLEKATKQQPELPFQFLPQQPPIEINTEEILSKCESNIKSTLESSIDEIINRKMEDIKTHMLETSEALVLQHMNDFNDRYEILATEILNVKNLLLELQNYTMGVNKMLLEERINIFSEITTNQFKTTNDEIKLDTDVVLLNEINHEQELEIAHEEAQINDNVNVVQVLENLQEGEQLVLENNEVIDTETPVDLEQVNVEQNVYDEATQVILDTTNNINENVEDGDKQEESNIEINQHELESDNSEFTIVSLKGKKGKNAKNPKKKNSVNVEQEISLST